MLYEKKDKVFMVVKKIINNVMLKENDLFTLVYDDSTEDFAKNVIEILDTGKICFYHYNLDKFGERPLKDIPKIVFDSAKKSDVTFIALKKEMNDSIEHKNVRVPLIGAGKIGKGRVGAIYNVPSVLFPEIFNYNFENIKDFNLKLYNMLIGKHKVHIKTDAGTDIEMKIDSDKYNLINQDGDLSKPSDQHSLLAGEVYSVPLKTEGRIVVDGSMGGEFSRFDFEDQPLIIDIEDSVVKNHFSENKNLENLFSKYLEIYRNFDCVGELGFGTNFSLKKCYNILGIDEKFPGNHIAFGNPYPKKTGADWVCDIHVDCVMKFCNTWIDGEKILEKGRYLI
ncbi:MAG: hypothetical protein ACQER9_00935 [Nanobdellota archaeon]